VALEDGRVTVDEATGAVVPADVDDAAAAEEGDREVLCGGFDVLLVAGDCAQTEARVARLGKERGKGLVNLHNKSFLVLLN